jgi:hypothetical protein
MKNMNENSRRHFIESLWRRLVDSRFNETDFINSVLMDCGHDASGLSQSDFADLLNDHSTERMREMAWTCNEVLAFYISHDLGSAEFVRAIFIALIGVETIKKGFGNWDFMFDKICMLLVQNQDKLDYRFRMDLLRDMLCSTESGLEKKGCQEPF